MRQKNKCVGHREQWTATFFVIALYLLLAVHASHAMAQNIPPELIRYPEMIIYNAKVHTADKDSPDYTVAEAVAVRDGHILYLGKSADALKLAGQNTLKLD